MAQWRRPSVDRIFIDNLRVKCRIGVGQDERRETQEVLVDVSLYRSLDHPGATGNMDDTINYREVMERVTDFVSGREFNLLESMASGVASLILNRYNVDSVSVRARKAKFSNEPSIGVEIERAAPNRGR